MNKIVSQLLKLYNLVSWKSYIETKNTQKPILAFLYLQKIINTLYKYYLKKLIMILSSIDFALPMTKSSIQLRTTSKQKQDLFTKNYIK